MRDRRVRARWMESFISTSEEFVNSTERDKIRSLEWGLNLQSPWQRILKIELSYPTQINDKELCFPLISLPVQFSLQSLKFYKLWEGSKFSFDF